MYKIKLTEAQKKSLAVLKERWVRVGKPQLELNGGGAVLVQCFYRSGHSMWVGIEPDGYRHS